MVIGRCIHKVQKLDQTQVFLLQRFLQRELKWEIKERKSSCSRKETKILSKKKLRAAYGGWDSKWSFGPPAERGQTFLKAHATGMICNNVQSTAGPSTINTTDSGDNSEENTHFTFTMWQNSINFQHQQTKLWNVYGISNLRLPLRREFKLTLTRGGVSTMHGRKWEWGDRAWSSNYCSKYSALRTSIWRSALGTESSRNEIQYTWISPKKNWEVLFFLAKKKLARQKQLLKH